PVHVVPGRANRSPEADQVLAADLRRQLHPARIAREGPHPPAVGGERRADLVPRERAAHDVGMVQRVEREEDDVGVGGLLHRLRGRLAGSGRGSRRARNGGTGAETWLKPASARVRAARKSTTARRVFASARWMDSSAVRLARSDVTPNVAPSTATTSSAEARKILAASPKRTALVPLEPSIRGIVLAVLVLVGHPAKAAGVELDREVGDPR